MPVRVLSWLPMVFCGGASIACHATPVELAEETTGTTGLTGTTADPTSPDVPTSTASDATTTTGTMPGSTGDVVDTGDTGTTTAGAWCGDGIVSGDEECDDSLAGNHDNRYCTADCTINVCGDGKLFIDWELCDEGEANSDAFGHYCSSQCQPGMRCGDHVLQPEFETCDLGADNGGTKGDEQGILCDASCQALQLRGFVTSEAFKGNMNGLFGADLRCRAAAEAAGLTAPERFHAFLSTGDVDAKERFVAVASLPYVLVTGQKFADDFDALLASGPLGEGISVSEHGTVLYSYYVASNTSPGGGSFSPDQHCQGWTSADAMFAGRAGLNSLPADSPDAMLWKQELWWTGFKSWPCDKALFHLYCLEI